VLRRNGAGSDSLKVTANPMKRLVYNSNRAHQQAAIAMRTSSLAQFRGIFMKLRVGAAISSDFCAAAVETRRQIVAAGATRHAVGKADSGRRIRVVNGGPYSSS
jgi:hypothetical protein